MAVIRVLRWIFGFDNLDYIEVRIVGVTLALTSVLVGLWRLYGMLAQ